MGRVLCLGNYYHQVSETHQRLELDDIQESPESEQTERGKAAPAPAWGRIFFRKRKGGEIWGRIRITSLKYLNFNPANYVLLGGYFWPATNMEG